MSQTEVIYSPSISTSFRALLNDCPELPFSVSVTESPAGLAEQALRATPPVMPVLLFRHEGSGKGDSALIGPLYGPGESVCPACLEHWTNQNLFDQHALRADDSIAPLIAAQLVALRGVEQLRRGAVLLNGADGAITWHAVFPRRDCPNCGARFVDAAATPLRIHCSPVTGIVNSLEATAHPTAGAFRATATWSSPLPVHNARPLLKRQDSYGRGRSREEAEAGCIGEALERYSLIYRGDEPLVRARIHELDTAIHPNEMLLYSESQYRTRAACNSTEDEDFFVGEPFCEEVAIDWMRAAPLGRGREAFVAAACCLMWYEFRPGEPEFARADTIGCGGGRLFEDAAAHALLEWIERDAMAIWWENRLVRPAIRWQSFESVEIGQCAQGLRAIGRDLILLDCTTDIGVPAYISVAPRHDGSEPFFAGAAHASPRMAAYKAASEVGQGWFEAMRSGGMAGHFRKWVLEATLGNQPHLAGAGLVDPPPEPPAESLGLLPIVERIEAAGLTAYVVDHSRADVLTHTVRAVVPGLRHIWNRRAPGRLYDVPAKMGWLPRAHREDELNPVRCMI